MDDSNDPKPVVLGPSSYNAFQESNDRDKQCHERNDLGVQPQSKDNQTTILRVNSVDLHHPVKEVTTSETSQSDHSEHSSFVSFSSHVSTPFDSILAAHSINLRSEVDNIKLNISNILKVEIDQFAAVTPNTIKNCSALNKFTLAQSLLSLLTHSENVCAVIGGRKLSESVCHTKDGDNCSTVPAQVGALPGNLLLYESLQSIQDSILDIKKAQDYCESLNSIKDQLNELVLAVDKFKTTGMANASTPDITEAPFSVSFLEQNPPAEQENVSEFGPRPVPCIIAHHTDFVDETLANELMSFLGDCTGEFDKNSERGHGVISFGHPYHYNGARASMPLSVTFPEPINKLAEQIKEKYPESVINQCLINRFTDGSSKLPEHSDDEDTVVFGSNIFTVSIGDTCDVAFQRRDGSEQTKVTVDGRSIYVMSRESQDHWSHRIDPTSNPEERGLRFSITFRYLSKNGQNATIIQGDSNTRFLKFGSGKGTFGDQLPGKRVQCFTIDQIDPKACVGYKQVVIHCGINDIKSTRADVRDCANKLISKLDLITKLCKGSKIILSPILPTKSPFLNRKAIQFNEFIFDYVNRVNPRVGCLDFNCFLDESGILASKFGRFRNTSDAIHLGSTGIFTLSRIITDKIRSSRVDGRAYNDVVSFNPLNPRKSQTKPRL
ncbi:hypothetical protein ACHWQZ_G004079 [Mnemiopsis leidyi]